MNLSEALGFWLGAFWPVVILFIGTLIGFFVINAIIRMLISMGVTDKLEDKLVRDAKRQKPLTQVELDRIAWWGR